MEISGLLSLIDHGGAVSAVAAVILGWFFRDQLFKFKTSVTDLLDAHELKDQKRHEDNLGRMGEMSERIARLERPRGR